MEGRTTGVGTIPRFGVFERIVARTLLTAFLVTGAGAPVAAEPTETALGPAQTAYGSGSFTVNTPTHTEYTQQSPRAIVDWGVDIQQGADHTLDFRQDAGFSVLNRSPGVHASNFYGTVTCDATCIFANEAGIYFHDGSFVDVGQLIAAGGTLATEDFAAGQLSFQDVMGEVVNHGTMRGESIALLGQRVANFGSVETPGGSFAMLAGNGVLLREHDSPIVIRSPLPPPREAGTGFADTPAVENAGRIDADGGEVRLAAGDLLSFAIRQTGEIRARRIALEGGQDGLVEVSGRLDASETAAGGVGGSIDVLGDYVAIVDDAELDASGSAGGGRIRIGGDRRGEGDTRTARGTYVGPDTDVRADALDDGDGGEVIVFARDTAQVYGGISARGGIAGGDGGFVETSGKYWLDVRGTPRVGARSGLADDRGGEWLIDPNNIEIVATPAQCGSAPECLDQGLSPESLENPSFANTGPILRPTVNDSRITADQIAHALETGTNVTILTETAALTPGTQVGDITVSAPIVVEEDKAPGPGTNVTLTLIAAQDIRIDQAIRVLRRASASPDAASDLTLDIVLFAADNEQVQAPQTDPNSPPNNFLGQVDVLADLDTAGGDLQLRGFGINLDPTARILTNGGALDALSIVGDIVLRGRIDTSSQVLNEVTNAPFRGGDVTMRSDAVRRPDTTAPDSPTTPTGVLFEITNHIETGGGNVDLTAEGGDLVLGGGGTATIATSGGSVILRALEQTLPPVTSADVAETVGGRITIEHNGRIQSDGGLVDVGVTDLTTFIEAAREIVVAGEIDTRRLDPTAPFDPGTPTGSLTFDPALLGGPVFFATVGENAAVDISPGVSGSPRIATNGGSVESVGTGSFRLVDATIDTRFAEVVNRPADLVLDSRIQIAHDGMVEILESAGGTTALLAESSILIEAGRAEGVGDLVFEQSPAFPGSPLLVADIIDLSAGDGAVVDSTGVSAQVLLGNVVIEGYNDAVAGGSPEAFRLDQDADLDADEILDNLPADLSNLERLTLAAWDGVISADMPDSLLVPGLDLTLIAGTDIVLPAGATSPGGFPLARLDVQIVQSFVLDDSLVDWLSGSAQSLRIGAGLTPDDTGPSLTVSGSSDPLNPMQLFASDELILNGGQDGAGDLDFQGETQLGAPSVTLQAGDGDATGTAEVRTAGLPGLRISDAAGTGQVGAYTLRQDRAIGGASLLDTAQFVGGNGVAGVQYTLRADASGSAITLDAPGNGDPGSAARLQDSRLRLYANGAIDLSALADASLIVESLDLGGISSFQYTAVHNSKFAFSPGAMTPKELIIRAALGGIGQLSFAPDLTITADEIRLVAGDGGGPGGIDTGTGGSITLAVFGGARPVFRKQVTTSPDTFAGPDEFVFRQDTDIVQASLPDLATNFTFGAPGRLGIRSDHGSITLNDFTGGAILDATLQVVLSAPAIELNRTDGQSLDLDAVFGDGSGGPAPAYELRGDSVVWRATGGDDQSTAEVLPGNVVRVSAFDRAPEIDALESPPAPFDFAAVVDAAPDVLALIQNGGIGASNLIALSQLGNGAMAVTPNGYVLTSQYGSIEVRPADVDQADLALILEGVDEPAGAGTRTVRFLDDSGPSPTGFSLSSLTVENPFGWTVGNAAATPTPLIIRATRFIDLLAALSNPTTPGAANLSFAGDVTLQSADISLQAGDDPLNPLRTNTVPTTPNAVVDTDSGNLTLVFDNSADPTVDTILRIAQHGSFSDDPSQVDPSNGSSLLIEASRIQDTGGNPTLIDRLSLTAILGDIEITDFGTGTSVLPAANAALIAGSGSADAGTIRIVQPNGDLDLSVDAGGNPVFAEAFRLFGRHIELVALPSGGGTAPTYVRAKGSNVLLLGPPGGFDAQGNPIFVSPESLTVEQNADFLEAVDDPADCTFGCLPDAVQLGPSLASGLDYTLISRNGQVYVNEPMTLKVWGSNLTLSGNEPDPTQPDVLFDIRTNRSLDFFLASLTIDESAAPDQSILLRGESDLLEDAFGNLSIVTAGAQTWAGPVEIDGVVELAGDIVEFSSTVDERVDPIDLKAIDSAISPSVVDQTTTPASGLSDLVVGIVTQGRFDGDVGTSGSTFDRLRIDFDPYAPQLATLRFGSAVAGPPTGTIIDADTIEFYAVSNVADDVRVPRAPLTSTIFKPNGDLTLRANTLSMGVGEKLTVQGALDIQLRASTDPMPTPGVATLGDLSAQTIRVGAAAGEPTPTIALQLRPAGSYLTRNGRILPDGGVDYVANTIDFAGNVVVTGLGKLPSFGIADPRTAPAFMNGFAVLGAQSSGLDLTPSNIGWTLSSILRDLHPDGASRDDIAPMYFAENLVPIPPADLPANWLPWQRSELTNLFVFARPPTRPEHLSWLTGAAVVDDVGQDLQAWDGRPMPIASSRLDGEGAKRAVELFEEIFGADGSNVDSLRRTLQRALDEYVRNTGARLVVGFELRRYVKNRPSSLFQAYQLLERLDTLFQYHRGLGLTPGEYRPIQARWLAAIRPDGITTVELAEAVQPSRYVRGTDVLDIFGD